MAQVLSWAQWVAPVQHQASLFWLLHRYGDSSSSGTGLSVTLYSIDSGVRSTHQEFLTWDGGDTRVAYGWVLGRGLSLPLRLLLAESGAARRLAASSMLLSGRLVWTRSVACTGQQCGCAVGGHVSSLLHAVTDA